MIVDDTMTYSIYDAKGLIKRHTPRSRGPTHTTPISPIRFPHNNSSQALNPKKRYIMPTKDDAPVADKPEETTEADDPLEKAEATKEKGSQSAVDGMKGEDALDAAIEDAESK